MKYPIGSLWFINFGNGFTIFTIDGKYSKKQIKNFTQIG